MRKFIPWLVNSGSRLLSKPLLPQSSSWYRRLAQLRLMKTPVQAARSSSNSCQASLQAIRLECRFHESQLRKTSIPRTGLRQQRLRKKAAPGIYEPRNEFAHIERIEIQQTP